MSNPDAGARQIYARRRPVSDPDARRYLLPAAQGIRIFRIEVMVIAVPAAMSNQGILSRYHEQVLDRGHGRLTVQANADRAYTGILDLADTIDNDRLADEVGVFRRGEAIPRYSNALNAGRPVAGNTGVACGRRNRARAGMDR